MNKSHVKKAAALIDELADVKRRRKALAEQEASIQTDLLNWMDELGLDTLRSDNGNNATRVQGTKVIIDDEQLKRDVGTTVWNRITRRVIDNALLEDAIATGKIDQSIVAGASSEVPMRAYVKITEPKS